MNIEVCGVEVYYKKHTFTRMIAGLFIRRAAITIVTFE